MTRRARWKNSKINYLQMRLLFILAAFTILSLTADAHLLMKVIVDDKGIKDCWKEYMEKLMNEENEWDHKISGEVKEGPADCIRMDEVRAALNKMKRHKAPGLSGLVTEMIQATGDIGTQWILDLCNGIVKEGLPRIKGR